MIRTELRGLEFLTHDDEDLSNAIRRDGDFFEAEILDWIRDNYPIHNVILDIGANIGNHSVYFAQYLRPKLLVAFEPIEENFELLKINLVPYKGTIAIQLALSAHDGMISMFLKRDNYGASHVHLDGDRQVACATLDRLRFENVTLMKIDVEEHEPAVLAGAADTIRRCQPLILIEDWHREYGKLMPSNYHLIKGWEHHQTFLYGPKND